MPPPGPARVYYGWIVAGALSVTETVSWGIIYYGFPVFLGPMELQLEASRLAVTGAFSLGMAVSALAALPVGRWLDGRGPRAIMTAGSCLGVALLLAWSRVESLPALYLVWGLMGLAMAATLYEPAFAAVVSWFPGHHRDRALLVVTLAGGLASTIFMPISAWLLEWLGWRAALVALAAILAVLTVPLHAFALRQSPHAGRVRATSPREEGEQASVPLAGALRTPTFWVLAAAFVISNFTTISVTVHLIPYLSDRGYSPAVAAIMIGWIGAAQLLGRVVFAPLAGRVGHRWMTAAIFVAQALGLVQLALATHMPTLVPMIVLLGASNGMSTLARASSLAEIFGPRHYGSIGGAIALGANGARAVGPVGASLLQVMLGGYEPVFWLLSGALVVAGVAVLCTRADDGRA
ncbi:MAG: MFS transporter [Candidatus Rokuibacteriota bacterium]